jgi:hypothetical protein
MFSIKINGEQRRIVATQNIEKNTDLFYEEIKFCINRNTDLWYEELILYELKYNKDKFEDLLPKSFDKHIIHDGIFLENYKNIIPNITNDDLTLYYNKIIRNAFNINKNKAVILYKGRMFNHSCNPNVYFDVVTKKNKQYMRFYTSRDIKKDEELFDNYFDVNLPYKKRQEISQTFYGFKCHCEKCIKKK